MTGNLSDITNLVIFDPAIITQITEGIAIRRENPSTVLAAEESASFAGHSHYLG